VAEVCDVWAEISYYEVLAEVGVICRCRHTASASSGPVTSSSVRRASVHLEEGLI